MAPRDAASRYGAAIPASSPQNVSRSPRRSRRVVDGALLVVALVEPVVAPLLDVAEHVVEAEGVGPELADRRGEDVAVSSRDRTTPSPGMLDKPVREPLHERPVRDVSDQGN